MSKAAENLRQILDIIFDCPPIEYLYGLPDTEYIKFHIEWVYKKRHHLLYKLFDEQHPDEANADKWKKIRVGCDIVFGQFDKEFNNKLDELVAVKESRMAYLRRTFDKLYSGPARYQKQKQITDFLSPKNFKAFKSQIDSEFWDELDEIGYALLRSSTNRMAFDYGLERQFQLEGEPLGFGYYFEKGWTMQQKQADSDIVSQEKQADPNLNEEVSKQPDNPFNGMNINKVKTWFMQLSTNNSTNGKPFLTAEQVGTFIERGFFFDTSTSKLTFNMAEGERTSVTKLFYQYYERCAQDYAIEPTKHCKEKYVRLLTDNFTNYNYKTVFSTFNKSKKAPKEWNITI